MWVFLLQKNIRLLKILSFVGDDDGNCQKFYHFDDVLFWLVRILAVLYFIPKILWILVRMFSGKFPWRYEVYELESMNDDDAGDAKKGSQHLGQALLFNENRVYGWQEAIKHELEARYVRLDDIFEFHKADNEDSSIQDKSEENKDGALKDLETFTAVLKACGNMPHIFHRRIGALIFL